MTDTRPGTFLATKEPRRFPECAEAVRTYRDIGLCYGPAGVGNTLSARREAHGDLAGPLIDTWQRRDPSHAQVHAALARSRTVCPTPPVLGAVRDLRTTLDDHLARVESGLDDHRPRDVTACRIVEYPNLVDLLICAETERLSMPALALIRARFDRPGVGVILIGMPGMDKRLSRSPQRDSRVGFAPHSRPLQGDDLPCGLTRHWRKRGLTLDDADFTDTQAIASIARITGGNFRLLHRLFVQIERILTINGLSVITDDIVAAARSPLVIGITER